MHNYAEINEYPKQTAWNPNQDLVNPFSRRNNSNLSGILKKQSLILPQIKKRPKNNQSLVPKIEEINILDGQS